MCIICVCGVLCTATYLLFIPTCFRRDVVVYDAVMNLRTALDELIDNVQGLTSDEKGNILCNIARECFYL